MRPKNRRGRETRRTNEATVGVQHDPFVGDLGGVVILFRWDFMELGW